MTREERLASLLDNSLWLVGATIAIALPLGILLGFLLVRTDMPGRRHFAIAFGVLLFLPLYLQAAAWQAGFGLQGWQTMIFAQSGTLPWLAGWGGAIWIHALAALPWTALIVGLGLRMVDAGLEEFALMHVSARETFLRITLLYTLPSIAAAALWLAMMTLGEMTVTDLFQVRTFAEELYTSFNFGDPGQIRSATTPLVAITTACFLLLLVAARKSPATAKLQPTRPPWRYELGAWRWPYMVLTLLVLLVAAGVPLANLLYMAGSVVEKSGGEVVRSWSPVKCAQMIALAPYRYQDAFLGSLLTSGLAATTALAVSIPLAWITRRGAWAALPALGVALLCAAVPAPVLALELIEVFNDPRLPALNYLYDHTIVVPWLVQTARALPIVILIVWAALRSVPQVTIEMGMMDGLGPLRRLISIALPQRRGAILLAWLVGLALALAELAGTVLVLPPGATTLSTQIFQLIHYGVDDRLAGLCLSMILLFTLLAIAIQLTVRRWAWRR